MSSHTWDQDDHLIQARFVDSGSDTAKTVDFHYCRTCSGSRTEKIVKDEYGFITEWLRYEMEGLNHLRIDEKWDSDDDDDIESNDAWRVQRVYYNGPGQLGQIVKATVWDYTSTPTATDYYYGYDILGNVSVISNNSGVEIDQFEQDAFGNEVESSWASPAGGITEHLTTKQYDADLGLYYFNARWYDSSSAGFLSRDPVKRPNNKTYAYCLNDPLHVVDPSGLDPVNWISGTLLMPLHQFLKIFHLGELHPLNVATAFRDASGQMVQTRCALTCTLPEAWGSAYTGAAAYAGVGVALYLTIYSYQVEIEAQIPSEEDQLVAEIAEKVRLVRRIHNSNWTNSQRLTRCANLCQEIVELHEFGEAKWDLNFASLPWSKCMKHCGW